MRINKSREAEALQLRVEERICGEDRKRARKCDGDSEKERKRESEKGQMRAAKQICIAHTN